MTHDHHTYQRALSGALLGLGAQALLTLALLGLSFYTASPAAAAAAFHAGGGILIWLLLVVIFQQHKLERLEALEAEQLAERHGSDSSIFETSADDLAVARRRLHRLVRLGLPLVSLATALYLLATGLSLAWDWRGILGGTAGLPEGVPVWLLGIAAAALSFVCFLISRYVAGMSKLEHWQLLRGGAGYLMGNAIVCGLLAVAFALLHFTMSQGLQYLTLIVPLLMLLVGGEIALNFVLDLYRPRRPGEVPRPAFDSRLLSLLTTPESIAATINEAINYQFGFEVTRSWFWQLLSRVFGWLVIFAAGVLLLMSCILVVQEHEQALVTRFGRLTTDQPLGPGLHFKMPWPISNADIYDVQRVRRLRAGSDTELKADKAILWSNLHTEDTPVNMIVAPPRDLAIAPLAVFDWPEKTIRPGHAWHEAVGRSASTQQSFAVCRYRPGLSMAEASPKASLFVAADATAEQLVAAGIEPGWELDSVFLLQRATPQPDGSYAVQWKAAAKTPSVSLVNTEVDVLYRIGDLMQYIQSSDQAMSTADAETRARRDEQFTVDRMLHVIAQRETARWLYTHDIDALIGTARQKANAQLQQRIQAAADRAKLGVRVTNVNLKSIHPPQTVAEAFHETVAARQVKQATIQQAEQEQIKTLATVAGSVRQAQRIVARIEALEALGPAADPKQVAVAENAVEDQLREAGGRAAAIVDAARAERWQRENVERGNAIRFEKELLAYTQSPRLYKIRGYLDVLGDGMSGARKYMLIGERDNLVLRFDLKDIGTGFDSLNLQADE